MLSDQRSGAGWIATGDQSETFGRSLAPADVFRVWNAAVVKKRLFSHVSEGGKVTRLDPPFDNRAFIVILVIINHLSVRAKLTL